MNTDAQAVSDVFCEVLEAFAFMFADPISTDPDLADQSEALQASMTYDGPSTGSITIVAPGDLCRTLAANAMGVDDEALIATDAMTDSLRELLNIACGNILTKSFGTSPVFHLSIPVVVQAGPEQWRQILEHPCSTAFCVDGTHIVAICFERSKTAGRGTAPQGSQ